MIFDLDFLGFLSKIEFFELITTKGDEGFLYYVPWILVSGCNTTVFDNFSSHYHSARSCAFPPYIFAFERLVR